MKHFKYILIIFFICIGTAFALQNDSIDYPVIGKTCPQFVLENVKYFNKSTVTNEDLKGKWFMLDFWGEYCAGCIASFPKMNEIQEQYADNFQLMLIGVPHKERLVSIEQVYEKHRLKLNLKMPITFERKLADQFQAFAYPHQVIVDPEGIVRYITTGVSKDDVKKIIDGQNPTLSRVYNAKEPKPYDGFDIQKPILIYGNGGAEGDYYIRSVFTKYSNQMPLGRSFFTEDKCQILNYGLDFFYKYAFTGLLSWRFPHNDLYGKLWSEVVLEIKDSTLFQMDFNTFENAFAYSAFVSEQYRSDFGSEKVDFSNLLRKELEILFPFKVSIEKRKMPCYELFISEDIRKKLKSSRSKLEFRWLDGYGGGFEAKAMTMLNFRSQLTVSSRYNRSIPLLYNGPEALIDIKLQSVYFEDRVKELKEMGIEIKKVHREMDAIVIRDK